MKQRNKINLRFVLSSVFITVVIVAVGTAIAFFTGIHGSELLRFAGVLAFAMIASNFLTPLIGRNKRGE